MTVRYRGRITAGQALAGTVALLITLLFTHPSLAGGDDHRALRFLRDKGIITQQEYDQAVAEEQPEKPKEPRANGVTKDGLQF
ncbi:MAG: hypothetical protein NTX84_02750, partial [Nitrospirae bacterium]|nr:hypothetical protein [Nitrospirota bacterium]